MFKDTMRPTESSQVITVLTIVHGINHVMLASENPCQSHKPR